MVQERLTPGFSPPSLGELLRFSITMIAAIDMTEKRDGSRWHVCQRRSQGGVV